jgi:N-carbamoyl-L-amino-acid hydrolase
MLPNLAPDMALATRLFDTLRERSFDGVGVTREAYGPGEEMAHALLRAEGKELGLESRTDHAGNLYLTLPGRDRRLPRVILGSHLDSVPQGGNYDGAAGVLAGLATLAGLRRAGFAPGRDLTVMAIRAEEGGAWFPGYPGSRGALGTLPPEFLEKRRPDSGLTLAEHMAALGFDPEAVRAGKPALRPDEVAACLEIHIEQGPVLDREEIPVGIVTGLPGNRRVRAGRVIGEYNHSGATPRAFRRDAVMAAAELAMRLDAEWERLDAEGVPLVCTFCTLSTSERAGMAVIPGEVNFQLDIRSPEQSAIDHMYAVLDAAIEEVGRKRGVTVRLDDQNSIRPTPMDPGVQQGLLRAAEALDVPCKRMSSGGGHDAGNFAAAGIPSGMLFVRNQNGSHNPDEAMRMEDFAQAAAVMLHWAVEVAEA